jgi:hypothetical protein
MPEMKGRQLAEPVLKRGQDCACGYTRNAIVHNGVLDHAVPLLPKPFTLEALALKLRDVLKSLLGISVHHNVIPHVRTNFADGCFRRMSISRDRVGRTTFTWTSSRR